MFIEIEVSDDESNDSLSESFNINHIDNSKKHIKTDCKANIENFFDIVMNEERQKELEQRIKIIGQTNHQYVVRRTIACTNDVK